MKQVKTLVLAFAVFSLVSVPFSVFASHKQPTYTELEAQVAALTARVEALENVVATLAGAPPAAAALDEKTVVKLEKRKAVLLKINRDRKSSWLEKNAAAAEINLIDSQLGTQTFTCVYARNGAVVGCGG